MKKNLLHTFLLASFIAFITSCSSSIDDFTQIKLGTQTSQDIETTLDETAFLSNLENVSAMFSTRTRTVSINEEKAKDVIRPFVDDGQNIKEQLLKDVTLTIEEREQIQNLTEDKLAALSVIAYTIVTANDASSNMRLHCVGQALVGGGSITGGLTWKLVRTLGTRTAVRMAASTLGGMVGGAIAIAMYINDYRLCMQNKKIEMPIDDYNIPINIVNEMDTTLIKGIL